MKKHFMYVAAAAIALMTSCTNEEVLEDIVTPENPNEVVDDGTTRMAIELGVADAAYSVVTRGTGTVGGTTTETNKWNSQTLNILMFEGGTTNVAKEKLDNNGNAYADPNQAPAILDGVIFQAPKSDATDNKIWMLTAGNTNEVTAKYYPMTGQYDFYGYHIDDIENTTLEASGTEDTRSIKVKGLVIDGTQDVLAAVTKEVTTTNYTDPEIDWTGATEDKMKSRAFSSWTARYGLQPILTFDHVLSRLTFSVEAGAKEAAEFYYNGTNWTENKASLGGEEYATAVTITKVELVDAKSKFDLDILNQAVVTEGYYTDNSNLANFTLRSINENSSSTPKELADALTATAPKAYTDGNNYVETGDGELYPQQTPMGESMMIVPGETELNFNIYVQQWVVATEDLDGNPTSYQLKKTMLPAKVKLAAGAEGAATPFKAGSSYNINIKIYGFQRIEVYAELTAWEDGEDVTVDPEDQYFESNQ